MGEKGNSMVDGQENRTSSSIINELEQTKPLPCSIGFQNQFHRET